MGSTLCSGVVCNHANAPHYLRTVFFQTDISGSAEALLENTFRRRLSADNLARQRQPGSCSIPIGASSAGGHMPVGLKQDLTQNASD